LIFVLPAVVLAQENWHPAKVNRANPDGRAHFFEVWNKSKQAYEPRVLVGVGNVWFGGNETDDDLAVIGAELELARRTGTNFLRMWLRPSDGKYAFAWKPGRQQVDLDAFNVEFFDRVDAILTMAEEKGIVVEVMIWDTSTQWHTLRLSDPASNAWNEWIRSNWNVHHPVNSRAGVPTGLPDDDRGKICFAEWYATNTGWWRHQTNYMTRLMAEITKHDNVTVELINEACGPHVPWRQEMHQWLRDNYGDLLIQSEGVTGMDDEDAVRALGPEGGVDMVSTHTFWTYDTAQQKYHGYPAVPPSCNEYNWPAYGAETPDRVRKFMWGLTMGGGVSYNETPPRIDPETSCSETNYTCWTQKAAQEAAKAIRGLFEPPAPNRRPAFWRMEPARSRVTPQPTPADKYVLSTSTDGHEATGQETLVYVDSSVAPNSTFRISNHPRWPYRFRWFAGATQTWGPWQHSSARRVGSWSFTVPGPNQALYAIVAPTAGDTADSGLGTADLQLRTAAGDVGVAINGAGRGFTAPVAFFRTLGPGEYDVYRGDVDGDTRADLISRRKDFIGKVQVFLSNGKRYVARGGWASGWGTSYDLYVADVSGDGKDDLIARSQAGGDVQVSYSNGMSFSQSIRWGSGWHSGYELFLADVDDDGRADLVARSPGDGVVQVATSTGKGFAPAAPWAGGFGPEYDLYFGDMDGDGLADLVARNRTDGAVYVMRSTGGAFAWAGAQPWGEGWGPEKELLLKDFTADGKADLLGRVTGPGTTDFMVAASTGTSLAQARNWGRLSAGDEMR
jgi:hypothetical protein